MSALMEMHPSSSRSGSSDKVDIPFDFVRAPSIGPVNEARLS
jgi:hypothetical protein